MHSIDEHCRRTAYKIQTFNKIAFVNHLKSNEKVDGHQFKVAIKIPQFRVIKKSVCVVCAFHLNQSTVAIILNREKE